MFYPNSNRSKRWDAIQETIGAWVESRPEPKVWNNSLRSHIYVSSKTRRELPYWGSKNPQSTEAICKHFSEIMRFAVKKEEVEPHSISGNSTKKNLNTVPKSDTLSIILNKKGITQKNGLPKPANC